MTHARRRLLACLPLALTPVASRGLTPDAATITLSSSSCVTGCAETAVHVALQEAVDAAAEAEDANAPRALRRFARCPFCGGGFGRAEPEPAATL
jgi:hypothetical protein